MRPLVEFLMRDDGQGMTEYGLILALFVVSVVGAMMMLGPKISLLFANTNNKFD